MGWSLEYIFFFFEEFNSLRFALGLSKMRQSTEADIEHVSFGMKCSSVRHCSLFVASMTGVTLFSLSLVAWSLKLLMYKTVANLFWVM